MHRIGISFKSTLTPDEVRERYIEPLRDAINAEHAGVYSNYLRQAEADPQKPDEHLLVFNVHDFEPALHVLRMKLQEIGVPGETTFHNLDPSSPMY
jgi:hypothetical protein